MLLPDVNVWLALAFDLHAHHPAARAWYDGSAEGCTFCRLTQQGFLRLATNPSVFKNDAMTLDEAWRMYDTILADPRISFTTEPTGLERYWRAYTRRGRFSPQVWNDAYLAAFARAASLEVVTFDKGFTRYKSVHCTILT